jgi:uncharacterized protein YjiK
MRRVSRRYRVLGLILGCVVVPQAAARPEGRALWHVRDVELRDPALSHPAGLAYSAGAQRLFVIEARRGPMSRPGKDRIVSISPFGRPLGSVTLPLATGSPINLAFDARGGRLVLFDAVAAELITLPLGADGLPNPARLARSDASALGILDAQGLTVDPDTGAVLVLDTRSRRVAILHPGARLDLDSRAAARSGRVSFVELRAVGPAAVRGLALDPGNRRLFVGSPGTGQLLELDERGNLLDSRSLGSLGLGDPQALVLAPSSDLTDDPASLSLFVADAGEPGRIAEVSLEPPAPAPETDASAGSSLVNTIDTSRFPPPSPDPSGLAYRPSGERLLVSDGEVEEMAIYRGVNVWATTLAGSVQETSTTTSYSDEPTGVAYNPDNGHYFFSDDDAERVYEVDPGQDGRLGGGDDTVTSFPTSPFGCNDPEGVAFDSLHGHLFVSDGVNREIYEVLPGANGRFDGQPPAGDDQIRHFDTSVLGLTDPEGVEHNPDDDTLFIISRSESFVAETTPGGSLVRTIDIGFLNAKKPAGVAYGPGSNNPEEKHLYIAARGVDNNSDPNENDGKVYEITLPSDEPPPPPPPSGTLDLRVNAGSDDAEEAASGSVRLGSNDLELVYDGSNQTVGLRFNGVSVPQGAAIVAAHVQFKADETSSDPTMLTIQGQAADFAPTFQTTSRDVSSRSRTAASVGWTPQSWGMVGEAGDLQRTPDLSSVIREIVNRPGWVPGNSLAILITGTGRRVAESYDGDAGGAPLVHIEYTTPGSSQCGNGIREAGEDCDGGDLGGATCQSRGFYCDGGGGLTCNGNCTYNTSNCVSGRCGDNATQGACGETCDGTDLGGETCQTQGFRGGDLSCQSNCAGYDTSGCGPCNDDGVCDPEENCNNCSSDCFSTGPACGNDVCEAAEGEDCLNCPQDCNGVQNRKPSARYCCGDGSGFNPIGCGDARCAANGNTCNPLPVPRSCCGNGTCESFAEDPTNCAVDCGS